MVPRLRQVPRLYFINNEVISPSAVARTPTHELFTRLGFFNHPRPGLVHWLPLGLFSLQKLQTIVHRRMQQIGAEQVSLLLLSHSALWQKTDRWAGTELFKLKDSGNHEYCLAATCEEEITHLVKNSITSYKNLPLLYYQINEKFRDEKRPRSGLLRGREFFMKDAYSFDVDEHAAMATYEKVVGAYVNIFLDLKVPFVKAEADTGEIGGSLSHEWHYVQAAGEDTLFTCGECGNSSNIEKTLSYPSEEHDHTEVAVHYFRTVDRLTLVCAYYPATRELQPNFVKEEVDVDTNDPLSQEEILAEFSNEDTLIDKKIVRVMDLRLTSRSNFPDFPIKFVNRSLITTLTDIPIVSAEEGELCHKCEEGTLSKRKSIEVGHTFYLGDKYSKALECTVDVPVDGKLETRNVVMGCYGIGVSRILAAIGEINRDEHGFRWPHAISPWDVTIINMAADSQLDAVTSALEPVDYRTDTRAVGLGKKIRQSNMVGIPLVVIVGKKYPVVEIEVRGVFFSESWKQAQSSANFLWEVADNKHLVPVEHLHEVVTTLLRDM